MYVLGNYLCLIKYTLSVSGFGWEPYLFLWDLIVTNSGFVSPGNEIKWRMLDQFFFSCSNAGLDLRVIKSVLIRDMKLLVDKSKQMSFV